MASNLEVTILENESENPDNPNPWQISMRWFEVMGELRSEYRSWTVDAPSELVAKTIKAALDSLTDQSYQSILDQGYVR